MLIKIADRFEREHEKRSSTSAAFALIRIGPVLKTRSALSRSATPSAPLRAFDLLSEAPAELTHY